MNYHLKLRLRSIWKWTIVKILSDPPFKEGPPQRHPSNLNNVEGIVFFNLKNVFPLLIKYIIIAQKNSWNLWLSRKNPEY